MGTLAEVVFGGYTTSELYTTAAVQPSLKGGQDGWFAIISHLGGDINGGRQVNTVDLAILAAQWQQASKIPSADIAPPGGDGTVNSLDFDLMTDNWLAFVEAEG